MISQIREKLSDCIGKNVSIKYNLGRNKYERYNAVIKELYQNVFIVESNDSIKKSFTYTDILTKTIKIDY
jgi:uncharacterized protein Veg